MNKKRLICFLCFALVIPMIYLTIRFNLFTVTKTRSLWALIVVALFLGVAGVLIKYYLDGMKAKYSLLKQILEGFVKVILPLIIALACTIFIYLKAESILNNMTLFIEALCVIICCEAVAIVINPLPNGHLKIMYKVWLR